MESVINFLADYYIWFFVAAIVLCFALVGFIIESKKKSKEKGKMESIPENMVIGGNPVDMAGDTNLSMASMELTESMKEEEPTLEDVTPVNDTQVTEDTMEINDIPLKEETKIPSEFYTENEVPVNKTLASDTPVIEEIPLENTTNNTSNEELETLDIFEDIK